MNTKIKVKRGSGTAGKKVDAGELYLDLQNNSLRVGTSDNQDVSASLELKQVQALDDITCQSMEAINANSPSGGVIELYAQNNPYIPTIELKGGASGNDADVLILGNLSATGISSSSSVTSNSTINSRVTIGEGSTVTVESTAESPSTINIERGTTTNINGDVTIARGASDQNRRQLTLGNGSEVVVNNTNNEEVIRLTSKDRRFISEEKELTHFATDVNFDNRLDRTRSSVTFNSDVVFNGNVSLGETGDVIYKPLPYEANDAISSGTYCVYITRDVNMYSNYKQGFIALGRFVLLEVFKGKSGDNKDNILQRLTSFTNTGAQISYRRIYENNSGQLVFGSWI